MIRPRLGELFAGYGGLAMGLEQALDAELTWYAEIDKAPAAVMAHHWPDTPNLGDVTQVEWFDLPPIDILAGGFPCQDVSHAGQRSGLRPETRTGLWQHFVYAIALLRPALVVGENVRGLLNASADSDVEPCPWCLGDKPEGALRALGAVLGDLAELGYDARWYGIPASLVGAAHQRFRLFIFATPADPGRRRKLGQAEHDGGGASRPWPLRLPDQPDRLTTGRGRGPAPDLTLLPTPTAANLGEGMTIERWDEWAPAQQAADGTPAPHGRSLSIEARRLLPTPAATDPKDARAHKGGNPTLPGALLGTRLRDDDWFDQAPIPALEPGQWGSYAPAIARHAAILGRPAPDPTEPGDLGQPRLSPRFVEWLMCLPDGHVTHPDIGLSRTQQLKTLGNGVVPPQAAAAARLFAHEEWG